VIRRQRTGSVICASCGLLVGVNDETCYSCGRRNPGLWGYGPALRALGRDMGFVPFVIGACVVVYGFGLLLSMGDPQGIQMGGLFSMLGPSNIALVRLGASGEIPVFRLGRWWTVLSAGWLHAGLLHIAFNMMALRQIAPAIAEMYGPGRMVIIYTAGSVVGFTLSSLAGEYMPNLPLIGAGRFTVGASAAIAGLIGAMWHYGKRGGSSMASSYASTFVLYMVVIGFMGGIDNWAHGGGFAGGYFAARFLDPLKPERVDHVAIAVGCLVLSIISIVVSVLMPLEI
jgi:membrane associated rhomboid family serine protease